MRKRKSMIVDIDGTLADCGHRLHFITGMSDEEATKTVDWDAFYADCWQDQPIEPTCQMVRDLLDANWGIIMMTGRSDKYRDLTEEWLVKNNLHYDLLLMRSHGDHTPDDDIKRAWLHMLQAGQISLQGIEAPTIALEDRARVVDMWREEGVIALQCDKGDF